MENPVLFFSLKLFLYLLWMCLFGENSRGFVFVSDFYLCEKSYLRRMLVVMSINCVDNLCSLCWFCDWVSCLALDTFGKKTLNTLMRLRRAGRVGAGREFASDSDALRSRRLHQRILSSKNGYILHLFRDGLKIIYFCRIYLQTIMTSHSTEYFSQ